ncbi:unnamed protein product [Lactuca virosa]|uniref:Multifunctional methyltransferase subunit TRM112-like protein n=1 Tax=Lactuca virosa TaxID=75947 RepID=A0AAU9LRE9_9ASTR|nr:unnamed protein product [Lactuca virosa]
MRLLTHNILRSEIRGVTNNYPLKIEVKEISVIEATFDRKYLKEVFSTINWKALVYASKALGFTELPDEVPDALLDSDEFLKKFHYALLELHLEEGALLCPQTGREFPVRNGTPHMALSENEMRHLSKEEYEESLKKQEVEGSSTCTQKRDVKVSKKKKAKKVRKAKEPNYKPKVEFISMSSDSSCDDFDKDDISTDALETGDKKE